MLFLIFLLLSSTIVASEKTNDLPIVSPCKDLSMHNYSSNNPYGGTLWLIIKDEHNNNLFWVKPKKDRFQSDPLLTMTIYNDQQHIFFGVMAIVASMNPSEYFKQPKKDNYLSIEQYLDLISKNTLFLNLESSSPKIDDLNKEPGENNANPIVSFKVKVIKYTPQEKRQGVGGVMRIFFGCNSADVFNN